MLGAMVSLTTKSNFAEKSVWQKSIVRRDPRCSSSSYAAFSCGIGLWSGKRLQSLRDTLPLFIFSNLASDMVCLAGLFAVAELAVHQHLDIAVALSLLYYTPFGRVYSDLLRVCRRYQVACLLHFDVIADRYGDMANKGLSNS